MTDREHAEWLRDEHERRRLHALHTVATKKRRSGGDDTKTSDAALIDVQDDADDVADTVVEEREAQDREDGQQSGNSV